MSQLKSIAGVICLLCALWLFLSIPSFLIADLFPQLNETDIFMDDEGNPFMLFSICGIAFAPILTSIIFLMLYRRYNNRQDRSRLPVPLLLLSLAIAIPLGVLATSVRTWDLFTVDAAIGQSLFGALGIWLALANLRAMRRNWFPKVVAIAGSVTGIGLASVIYISIMGAVNPNIRQSLNIAPLYFFILPFAMFVWAAGMGVWLLFRKNNYATELGENSLNGNTTA